MTTYPLPPAALRALIDLHPLPWAVQQHTGYWDVIDAKGQQVFDDGTAGDEYGAACSVDARDGILAAVNALPALLASAEMGEAERAWWRLCVERSEWFRNDGRTHLAVRVHDDADLSCQATREDAMRRALPAAGERGV